MTTYTAAVVAAGSQGRVHAQGYARDPRVQLVAVADTQSAAADQVAADFDATPYADYVDMLERERPDIVSICTPPAAHLEVARAAVAAGARAIHCEKPVALSFGDVVEMQRLADEAGVQLSFNLQRRFEPVHRFAREQIAVGAIGELVSIEAYCPNLFDWGTHVIDLMFFYRGDMPAEWVVGQIDVSVNRYVYNAFAETSSLTQLKWADGVNGLVITGREPSTPVLNVQTNLGLLVQGTEGRIDSRGPRCVVSRFGAEELVFDSPFDTDPSHWDRHVDPAIVTCTAAAIADAIDCLGTGATPVCGARHGVAASEVIFATYASSSARARVGLPLQRTDNALTSGLEAGFWHPAGELRSTY